MTHFAAIDVDVEVAKEEDENVKEKTTRRTKFMGFVNRQLLPIGTVFSIILGIFVPRPAVYLSERMPIAQICAMVLFFCVGLRLRLHEAKSAVKCYKEILVGLILVLFVCPVIGTNVLRHIHQFGPLIGSAGEQNLWKNNSNSSNKNMNFPMFGPEEFRLALQILIMCPSAIATSLIMVTAANGHRGLSILISVLCTLLSVFTIPAMLVWLIPSLQHVHIDAGKVLLNTVIRILLPMLVGRSLRFLGPVKKVIKQFDNAIKYTSISFIVAIFHVKVSQTSSSGNLERISVLNILCVVALGTSLTSSNLVVSYTFLSILPWFSKKSAVTLSILCSIPIVVMAATIVDVLPDNAGDKGLLTLPGIFVFLASLLVSNCFVTFVKVPEDVSNDSNNVAKIEQQRGEEDVIKEAIRETITNYDSNEVPVFTIYTDEIPAMRQKL